MFNWLKRLFKLLIPPRFPQPGDIFLEMDEERKKNNEVWHYTCNNGHKWRSYSSPTGSFCSNKYGMSETACPECKSTITMGEVYRNGIKTQMGAIHMDFKENG